MFLNKEKCLRLYGKADAYCVYPVDLVFCVLIIMLLLPQIIVVCLCSSMNSHAVTHTHVHVPTHTHTYPHTHTRTHTHTHVPTHTHTHTHTHTSQAYWYRRGELEPKFRRLIYYNAIVTILLCVCGNLYFFQLGFENYNPPTTDPPSTTASLL